MPHRSFAPPIDRKCSAANPFDGPWYSLSSSASGSAGTGCPMVNLEKSK